MSRRWVSRVLLLLSSSVVPGGCSVVGGGVTPGQPPGPVAPAATGDPRSGAEAGDGGEPAAATDRTGEASIGAVAGAVTERVVDVALASIGTPYEWGGTDANGFDCSGLIQFAYGRLGIPLPRTSSEQLRAGRPVAPETGALRPGDILGFSDDGPGRADHVGLYVGAGEFIHSSSSGVRVSSLWNAYWRDNLVAARRIVE